MTFVATPSLPADAPDAAIARMERRLRLLEEISQIGMQLVRAVCRDVQMEQWLQDQARGRRGDPAALYATLSRAIRLTISLEMRVEDALVALHTGVVAAAPARAEGRAKPQQDTASAVDDIAAEDLREPDEDLNEPPEIEQLRDPVETESDNFGDLAAFERALDARLDADPAEGGFKGLPIEETVRRLCVELQMIPDAARSAGEDAPPRAAPDRPARAYGRAPRAEPGADDLVFAGPSVESRRRRLE